jgi:16S rRNA (cytosine967-C5)-methyltransferase
MGKTSSFRLYSADNDPRAAALTALFRVIHENTDSQAALDAVLRSPRLAPTDKRLCTELLYGTLRRYIGLRALICGFLPDPEGIPEEMLLTLVAAAYETAFLRSPHRAAVSWAVGHIGNRFGRVMAGVGNGVLRAVLRDPGAYRAAPAAGENPDASPSELAVAYDIPERFVRLWIEAYDRKEVSGLLRASCRAAPSGLRMNCSRPGWEALREDIIHDAAEVNAARGKEVLAVGPCALAFTGRLPVSALRAVSDGGASRQSAAAYEILQAFSPSDWPRPIWDCCAGRGGKTMTLLEQGIPVALATDRSAGRLRALLPECARLGIAPSLRPATAVLDLTKDASLSERLREIWRESLPPGAPDVRREFPEQFGAVLLDAPCSGLGTLAARPEIRLRRRREDMEAAAALQSRLLDRLWPLLRPGGRIIYITCTVNPGENEGQVAAFLGRHPDAASGRVFRTPFSSPLGEFFYGAELIRRSDRGPGACVSRPEQGEQSCSAR